MEKHIGKALILLVLILLGLSNTLAQEKMASSYILPGPERTLLLLQGITTDGEVDGILAFPKVGERFDVFRADGGGGDFKKVGSTAFPSSAAELGKKLGDDYTADVLSQLNVKTVDEAYQVLLRTGPDTLGLTLLWPDLLEAFGMAYSDHLRNPAIASIYRIDHIDNQGEIIRHATARVEGVLPAYQDRFSVNNYQISDSTVVVSWFNDIALDSGGLPLFANIYRRESHQDVFQQVQKLLIVSSATSDSSWVYFSEQVQPGSHLAYYMQVEDFAGNVGQASDTLHAMAANLADISSIGNLQVSDTTNGLLLTWDPLPRQAVYSAIQILKSRELGADYVVVDTIPATEMAYLDEKVVAASSYYYKVRPLIYNLPGSEPLVFAEANGHKGSAGTDPPPAPPRDVRAVLTPQGVQVNWQHGDELNLFGYYVLRGTSTKNLEVISQPVQDTVYLDSLFSPGFSGQFHYAVQVMNLSQVVSDTSAVASVTILQPVVLSPPGGIQARHTVDGVALQWEHVADKDDNVEGYVLYRRNVGEEFYQPINAAYLIRLPFYTDSSATSGGNYEYAVTSADSWGNQSILSPVSTVAPDRGIDLAPPLQLNLRNLAGGIEISWPVVYESKGQRYIIYRRQVAQTTFERLASADATEPYVDNNVKPDVLYEYAVGVQAHDVEGEKSIGYTIRRR